MSEISTFQITCHLTILTETFNMSTKKFNIMPETFPYIARNAKSEKSVQNMVIGHVGTLKRGLEKPK